MDNKIGICFAKEDRSMFLEELIRKFRENPKVIMEELEVQPALHSNSSTVINSSEFYMLILIVSRYNINTSWARNLLGTAKKQASNDPHKIIIVLIDESITDEELTAGEVVRLFNQDDYSLELLYIRTLAGMHISEHLNFNSTVHVLFPDLSESVNSMFLLLCNDSLAADYPRISVLEFLSKHHFSYNGNFENSLQILESSALIEKLDMYLSDNDMQQGMIRLTALGMNKFLQVFYQNYENVRKSVIEFIIGNNSDVNRSMLRSELIAKTLRQSKLIINTILEDLELSGKIQLRSTKGENWEICKVEHSMFEHVLKPNIGLK